MVAPLDGAATQGSGKNALRMDRGIGVRETTLKGTTMTSLHLAFGFEDALMRHEELLRTAARDRLIRSAKADGGRTVGGLRRRFGCALVSAGERIGGVERAALGGTAAPVGELRPAP
jgi:hypothetical protein